MEFIVGCLLVITVISLYFPIIHIRLTNKVLKALQQIEINTRK
jgi:hypothetical protein